MGEICRLGRVELSKQDITGCNGHSQLSRAGHKSKNGRKASGGGTFHGEGNFYPSLMENQY